MPTPAEHVAALRLSGDIKQILDKSTEWVTANPDDLALKLECTDVFFEAMSAAHEQGHNDEAIAYYKGYQALGLPEDELALHEKFKLLYRRLFPEYPRMQEANKLSKSGKHLEALAIYEDVLSSLPDYSVAFVNVGWCIYRLLADLAPEEKADVALVNKCLALYNQFEIHGPSNLHSQMLRISLYFKDYPEIPVVDFVHSWNFENFREEDYEPFRANGGNTIPSFRERAYLTYTKLLIDHLKKEGNPDHDKILGYAREFLPELDRVLPELPRNVWLPYARARLMVAMGMGARAEAELTVLIRQRTNEFWAWAAMAEVYRGKDDSTALACYSKAMLLPTQGELAVSVRENLAELLVNYEYYNEAKTEIEQIVLARKKKEWKITPEIQSWRDSPWYETARPFQTNKSFYIKSLPKADVMLWADIPDSIAIVTHVDKVRAVFFFAVDRVISGKHNLKGPATKLKVGDIVALKLREMETAGNKWYKVLSLRMEPDRIPDEITRFVEEYIQIPRGRDFGFLKPSNVYVTPDLIRQHNILDGQKISGLALLSYNKQKNDWSWKLLAVDN